jgi:hypothetical protein
MDFDGFRRSLAGEQPPAGLDPALAALWWDARGDWDRAHGFAQQQNTQAACAVHAYLHRKEGDLSNARYWYARAGKEPAAGTLEDEWDALARELLATGGEPG